MVPQAPAGWWAGCGQWFVFHGYLCLARSNVVCRPNQSQGLPRALGQKHLDAAILGAAGFGVVVGNRLVGAAAVNLDAL